jgi:queuosine precursor transporter
MDDFVKALIEWVFLNVSPLELSAVTLIICYFIILALWHLWKENGLYLYNILAIVAGNIQVLKLSPIISVSEPVALGTLLFTTSFIATDIIAEHKGYEKAKLSVYLCFAAQIIMTLWMIITIAYQTIDSNVYGFNEDGEISNSTQYSLYILFLPSIRILTASVVAYSISQFVDIMIFRALKQWSNNKYLWLRSNASTIISGLVDNILFSLLAWVVLSPTPVSIYSLIFTYILGTYIWRVVISITSTPIMYLSYDRRL